MIVIGEIAEATEKLYAEAPRCYVIGPALDSVLDILAELSIFGRMEQLILAYR